MLDEWPTSLSGWLQTVDPHAIEEVRAVLETSSDRHPLQQEYQSLAFLLGEDTALRILATRIDDFVPCIDVVVAMENGIFGDGERSAALERTARRICEKWRLYPSLKHLLIKEAKVREMPVEAVKREKIVEALFYVYANSSKPEAHRFRKIWMKGYDGKALQVPLEKLDVQYAWYRLRNKTIQVAAQFTMDELARSKSPTPRLLVDASLMKEWLNRYATPAGRIVLEDYYVEGYTLADAARRHHMSPATARVHKYNFIKKARIHHRQEGGSKEQ